MLLLLLVPATLAAIADYRTVPKGLNPTLYSENDYVVQLDESTFNDTVYCDGPDCSAYLVEFYSDWCGHCRSFSPLYKALAKDVKGWQPVVKIAAMNCADAVNEVTCRANGVQYFPYIKYFPRNSTGREDGSLLRPFWSVAQMRQELLKVVMDDYSVNRFDDWPKFDHLPADVVTFGELWEDTPPEINHMAVVFENHQASLTGAELLLDLMKYKDNLMARRCLKNHPLVETLHIVDFPSMVILKRGEKKPIVTAELRRLILTEIENFMGNSSDLQQLHFSHHRKNKTLVDPCEKDPEGCRALFYVSEVDLLKAMHYALYREPARTDIPIQGENLTALLAFTNLLADHFPVVSRGINETYLQRSNRAVKVFAQLRDILQKKVNEGASMSVEEWQKEFDDAEKIYNYPFPVNDEWGHCKGSSNEFRGFTCGLWTSFHALTVSAYRQAAATNLSNFRAMTPLEAIRGWVKAFFGCEHCREHFIKMSTKTFAMEDQVHTPEDVFMYLWKAHNIVNARLRGRDAEDPKFPKYQFPGKFLCADCESDTTPNETVVRNFLLDYYSNIKPYNVGERIFERLRR